jgi:dCMP deaminase
MKAAMVIRPSWDQTMADLARVWAERSTCSARARVGAVLVNEEHVVVASGYNGAPRGQPHCDEVGCLMEGGHCVRAIHAEENAIIQCARGGSSTIGTTLYATHRPCVRCARLIIQAGIVTVRFLHYYDADGMMAQVLDQFLAAGVEAMVIDPLELYRRGEYGVSDDPKLR